MNHEMTDWSIYPLGSTSATSELFSFPGLWTFGSSVFCLFYPVEICEDVEGKSKNLVQTGNGPTWNFLWNTNPHTDFCKNAKNAQSRKSVTRGLVFWGDARPLSQLELRGTLGSNRNMELCGHWSAPITGTHAGRKRLEYSLTQTFDRLHLSLWCGSHLA